MSNELESKSQENEILSRTLEQCEENNTRTQARVTELQVIKKLKMCAYYFHIISSGVASLM